MFTGDLSFDNNYNREFHHFISVTSSLKSFPFITLVKQLVVKDHYKIISLRCLVNYFFQNEKVFIE